MLSPSSLLPCLARALLNVALDPLTRGQPLGGLRVEVAREAWQEWSRDGNDGQRQQELQELARLPAEELRRRVVDTVKSVTAGHPETTRIALRDCLLRFLQALRRASRPSENSTGKSQPPGVTVRRPEDLARLLPGGAVRTEPGERSPAASRFVLLGGLIGAGVLVVALVVVVLIAIISPADRTDRSSAQADTSRGDSGRTEIKPTGAVGNGTRNVSPVKDEPREIVAVSVGMKLVRIEAGSFLMGSPDSDTEAQPNEKPQHKVTLTKPYYLGQHEVTVGQFEAFVKDNPGFKTDAEKDGVGGLNPKLEFKPEVTWRNPGFTQTADHPVVNVSWNDAVAFCAWLSKKEGRKYRLPTEAEWEYAYRAGSATKWNFGDDVKSLGDHAWYSGNSGGTGTHPVGRKKPNAWNLFDMHGNAAELCADAPRSYENKDVIDPDGGQWGKLLGGQWGQSCAIRGGSYIDDPIWRGAYRNPVTPEARGYFLGFRVAASAVSPSTATRIGPPPPPTPAVEPREIVAASVNMKLVRIESGSFLMGSPDSEVQEGDPFQETPRHKVTLTKPFYLGQHEVTVGQFEAFVKDNPDFKTDAEKNGTGCGLGGVQRPEYNWRNPGFTQNPDHPVVNVSWNDAVAFCAWLSKKEGRDYRLPTEAEWEYACRAGSQTKWSFGADAAPLSDHAWYDGNSKSTGTRPVGRMKPNAWKLFDLHGNAWEWCADDMRQYTKEDVEDPQRGKAGVSPMLRGGGWMWRSHATDCHSAIRLRGNAAVPCSDYGFRVASTSAAPSTATRVPAPTPPAAIGPEAAEIVAVSVGMKLVRIEAGSFLMGSPNSDTEARENEKPRHKVTLTKPYYLGQCEVTVGQFEAFVKDNPGFKTDAEKERDRGVLNADGRMKAVYTWRDPGYKQAPDHPVVCVSWNDAVAFCGWLSKKEGREYRLPTEAEWEYACRAGTTTQYYFGDDRASIKDYAWSWSWNRPDPDSNRGTGPVGRKKSNAWKLYDMAGNVREWCSDVHRVYTSKDVEDPDGGGDSVGFPATRGGSFGDDTYCRSAASTWGLRARGEDNLGFRVAAPADRTKPPPRSVP